MFEAADTLMELWKVIEKEALAYYPLPMEETDGLTVQRYGANMRLVYNGRPLSECSLQEKINASKDLDNLSERLRVYKHSKKEAIEAAIQKLEAWELPKEP